MVLYHDRYLLMWQMQDSSIWLWPSTITQIRKQLVVEAWKNRLAARTLKGCAAGERHRVVYKYQLQIIGLLRALADDGPEGHIMGTAHNLAPKTHTFLLSEEDCC